MRAIRDRLREIYGIPLAKPHGHPIAELILTVLSQSTNDRNRDVAYFALRDRFEDWEAIRDAPVDLIEEAIRPGGISKVKSARIKSILRAITDPPRPDRSSARRALLDWLASQPVPEAQRYLASLPGVGRKTAACVLLFALGMRDVPVDTHVSRVGCGSVCSGPVRRSRSFTTRCSRSRHPARSSSFTSTCCATAGGRATPSAPSAVGARYDGCVLARISSDRGCCTWRAPVNCASVGVVRIFRGCAAALAGAALFTATTGTALAAVPSWSSPAVVDRTVTPTSVSCPTATFCAAVGGDVYTSMSRGAWLAQPVVIDSQGAALQSVSCVSSSFCAAVDGDGRALTFDGTAWSAPVKILTPQIFEHVAVSCTSSSFCLAADNHGNAFTYNGRSWVPAGGLNDNIQSVSCGSPSFCVAGTYFGQAHTFNGSSWSGPVTVDSGSADALGDNVLSLSCPSTSFCIAVDEVGDAVMYTNGTWSAPRQIDPGSDTAGLSPYLTSVSCASSFLCVAVDVNGRALAFNGSSWTRPKRITVNNLTSVSCPPALTTCVTVARNDNAFTYSGGGWSAHRPIGADGGLVSVSCTTRDFCIGVDHNGRALTFDGGGWNAPKTIAARGLRQVSCASRSFCLAEDDTGNMLRFAGGSWRSAGRPDRGNVDSFSCVSRSFCMAVDGDGRATGFNGSGWSARMKILDTDPFDEVDVSCARPAFCAAIDTDLGNATAFTGRRWSRPRHLAESLGDVSCSSRSFCIAGLLLSGLGPLIFNGRSWARDRQAGVDGASVSLSCASSRFCAEDDDTGLRTFDGRTWTEPNTIDPSTVYSLSCVPEAFCVAVDAKGRVLLYS